MISHGKCGLDLTPDSIKAVAMTAREQASGIV
jgi:hypothetical protein